MQNSDLGAVYQFKKRPVNCNLQGPVKRKTIYIIQGVRKALQKELFHIMLQTDKTAM